MKTITETECLEWLNSCGLPTRHYAAPWNLLSDIPFQHLAAIRFSLPEKSGQKVALARALFWQWKPESDILVWLANWVVFPSCGHLPLLSRLRKGMGSDQPLENAPGHLFSAVETDDAMSLLIVGLSFYLDCFIADAQQRLMVFLSHDDYLVLMGADCNYLNKIGDVLVSAKWCRRLSQKEGFGAAKNFGSQ